MLMMLALRLADCDQDRRERWKGSPADADDARVAAR